MAWNVFAGYSNSGSPSSGLARYFLGRQVGGLLTPDSLLSYQFTTSSDFWIKNGDLFGDAGMDIRENLEAYEHKGPWQNRMILGDSLLVMTSLAEKEGLKGKVQTIYLDPPHRIAAIRKRWPSSTTRSRRPRAMRSLGESSSPRWTCGSPTTRRSSRT